MYHGNLQKHEVCKEFQECRICWCDCYHTQYPKYGSLLSYLRKESKAKMRKYTDSVTSYDRTLQHSYLQSRSVLGGLGFESRPSDRVF